MLHVSLYTLVLSNTLHPEILNNSGDWTSDKEQKILVESRFISIFFPFTPSPCSNMQCNLLSSLLFNCIPLAMKIDADILYILPFCTESGFSWPQSYICGPLQGILLTTKYWWINFMQNVFQKEMSFWDEVMKSHAQYLEI